MWTDHIPEDFRFVGEWVADGGEAAFDGYKIAFTTPGTVKIFFSGGK